MHVYVNDAPIYGSAGIDLRGEMSRHHGRALAVELLPGRDEIEVATRSGRVDGGRGRRTCMWWRSGGRSRPTSRRANLGFDFPVL